MTKRFIYLIGIILMVMNFQVAEAQDEKETLVLIETDMGKIKVKLYNDTPLHRDNFIKNVKEHLYDGLLFHRVIRQFMVQAGDIHSKDAPADKHLGDDDPDYTIPAEIVYPKHYHKAGALCAARTADEVNPKRESSASQFYIVTGKFFTSMELDKMEKEKGMKFTDEERHSYMLEGGRPDLDGQFL
jgi:cyclophilin family peptidyl-prolyl cis-trans isomerase